MGVRLLLVLVGLVPLLLGGCFRFGYTDIESDSPQPRLDTWWPHDGPRPDGPLALDGPIATEGVGPADTIADGPTLVDGPIAPLDLKPDLPNTQTTVKLVNSGQDPLNPQASGTLVWSVCGSTFTGELVVKDLAPGQIYQLKLDQNWSVDYPTGKNLGSMCRTWDETIWSKGDVNNLLPSPHTGAPAGDVHAANIGDYLPTTDQDALYQAGHDLLGYLMFAFFEVTSLNTAKYNEDDQTPAKQIVAKSDGFHLPIHVDFSWHTSASAQKGFVTFPKGAYKARFLVTREGDWKDPLVVNNVSFQIGSCP